MIGFVMTVYDWFCYEMKRRQGISQDYNRHNYMFSNYNSVTVMKLCKKKYEMKKTWHLTRLYIHN